MGKALKLVNVDFSSVALDTITYGESKACTAIALDYNVLSFDTVGETKTLTATVTPSDTTDTVIWSSSNPSVASVADGVVTIHGIGSVTITATCGTKSATCEITQTSIKAAGTLVVLDGVAASDYAEKLALSDVQNNTSIGRNYTNADALRVINGSAKNCEAIPVPYGATVVKMATENDTEITCNYMYYADCDDLIDYYNVNYPTYIGNTTFFRSKTGKSVTPGNCLVFRATSALTDTPTYVYFE